jgi:haloalkane dehalogenase
MAAVRYEQVHGLRMAYREVGRGDPVVFLGRPSSPRCRGRDRTRPILPDPALFGPLRGPDGERLVLAENVFVEKVLPAGTLRELTAEKMDGYRSPYREPGESRRPTLTWPREIPIDGEPADVHEIVTRNAQWMASSPVPKLFVNGDPGALLTGPLREQCRRWPVQDEVTVPGLHFLPEDSAPAIAGALNAWLGRLA